MLCEHKVKDVRELNPVDRGIGQISSSIHSFLFSPDNNNNYCYSIPFTDPCSKALFPDTNIQGTMSILKNREICNNEKKRKSLVYLFSKYHYVML